MNLAYALRDPLSGAVRYIGKSTSGMRRPRSHLSPSSLKRAGYLANWLRQLNALGLAPSIEILEQAESKSDLAFIEPFWIAQGRGLGWPLTNIAAGGEGAPGVVPSVEKRAKLSKANRGQTRSEQSRALMRANKKRPAKVWLGKKRDAETTRKISETLAGRWQDPEFKAKQLAARPTLTAERKSDIAAKIKSLWADPEYRASQIAKQNAGRALAKGGK